MTNAEKLPKLPPGGVHDHINAEREFAPDFDFENDDGTNVKTKTPRLIYPRASDHNAAPFYIDIIEKVKHQLQFNSPFYSNILNQVQVYYSEEIATAMVTYHLGIDAPIMVLNPHFIRFFVNNQRYNEVVNIFVHEILHIALKHIDAKITDPFFAALSNIAQDLCIDSFIENNQSLIEGSPEGSRKLPRGVLMPGVEWCAMEGIPEPTAEQLQLIVSNAILNATLNKAMGTKPEDYRKAFDEREAKKTELRKQLNGIIKQLPHNMTTEWYLQILMDQVNNSPDPEALKELICGSGGDSTMDDHSFWDNLPEEYKNYIKYKFTGVLKNAVNRSDTSSNGWGNFPEHVKQKIRDALSGAVHWKEVLKLFIGNKVSADRHSTMKKVSRKAPYIHPGRRRSRKARILIAQDQSGSVSNEMTAQIFSTLDELKNVNQVFDWVAFDFSVVESSLTEIKRGREHEWNREASGGTNFQAVIDFVNSEENRGRWEAVIIATDGECSRPTNDANIPLAYILPPGCKLYWTPEASDVVINMENAYDDTKEIM